eukprot:1159321-Pelagomonas_calceolata.AAC.8
MCHRQPAAHMQGWVCHVLAAPGAAAAAAAAAAAVGLFVDLFAAAAAAAAAAAVGLFVDLSAAAAAAAAEVLYLQTPALFADRPPAAVAAVAAAAPRAAAHRTHGGAPSAAQTEQPRPLAWHLVANSEKCKLCGQQQQQQQVHRCGTDRSILSTGLASGRKKSSEQ